MEMGLYVVPNSLLLYCGNNTLLVPQGWLSLDFERIIAVNENRRWVDGGGKNTGLIFGNNGHSDKMLGSWGEV